MSSHRIGIIGGSGLYQLEGFANQKWVKIKTPFGAPSDELLTGTLAGRDLVFLPRHGRGHRLMPSELNHRANLWAMKKLDVAWIISVSAVGSLQPKYKPCDIVLIDATNPFGNGMSLPAGPMREGISAIRRCQIVLITRCESVDQTAVDDLIRKVSRFINRCDRK